MCKVGRKRHQKERNKHHSLTACLHYWQQGKEDVLYPTFKRAAAYKAPRSLRVARLARRSVLAFLLSQHEDCCSRLAHGTLLVFWQMSLPTNLRSAASCIRKVSERGRDAV